MTKFLDFQEHTKHTCSSELQEFHLVNYIVCGFSALKSTLHIVSKNVRCRVTVAKALGIHRSGYIRKLMKFLLVKYLLTLQNEWLMKISLPFVVINSFLIHRPSEHVDRKSNRVAWSTFTKLASHDLISSLGEVCLSSPFFWLSTCYL